MCLAFVLCILFCLQLTNCQLQATSSHDTKMEWRKSYALLTFLCLLTFVQQLQRPTVHHLRFVTLSTTLYFSFDPHHWSVLGVECAYKTLWFLTGLLTNIYRWLPFPLMPAKKGGRFLLGTLPVIWYALSFVVTKTYSLPLGMDFFILFYYK